MVVGGAVDLVDGDPVRIGLLGRAPAGASYQRLAVAGGLAAGGDPHWWMRFLVALQSDGYLVQIIEFAVVGYSFLCPQLFEDDQRFIE